jgi:hypothetical protein
MIRCRARCAAALITAVSGCALIFGSAAEAAPVFAATTTAPPSSGQAASGWLARQLVNGNHFVTVYSGTAYPNQGETIDAIFAFAATKSANHNGARAIRWLERPGVLSSYIGSGTESYAGATAKVALAAEVRGINPARFGTTNLIRRLGKLLTKSGRYSDHSQYGDFSNAFSQSLAIIALTRHGGAPASAVSFLVSSECKNGGFPLNFGQKTCVSDTDSTAMDVQALLAAGGHRAAAVRGLTWLKRVQHPGGGLDASGATRPNANTTGLAGEAFAAARWFRNAALAAKFLRGLQLGCSARSSQRGAIAYDSAGFAKSTAIDATAQGILGLADVSLAGLSASGSSYGAPRLACAS